MQSAVLYTDWSYGLDLAKDDYARRSTLLRRNQDCQEIFWLLSKWPWLHHLLVENCFCSFLILTTWLKLWCGLGLASWQAFAFQKKMMAFFLSSSFFSYPLLTIGLNSSGVLVSFGVTLRVTDFFQVGFQVSFQVFLRKLTSQNIYQVCYQLARVSSKFWFQGRWIDYLNWSRNTHATFGSLWPGDQELTY